MPQTSREIVQRCLTFDYPEKIPLDLWVLPWADIHHPAALKQIREKYPSDFTSVPGQFNIAPKFNGDRYNPGYYTDEWGCVFKNIQEGIIGEVEIPLVKEIEDWRIVKPPYEQLQVINKDTISIVNRFCAETDKFVSGGCCPRPWERYQFLRGSENSLIDVLMPDMGRKDLLKRIHDFYLKELEFWVKTDVDAVMFMDDWGSQNQLLIPPPIWQELFKPLYKDYCDLAKAHNKFVFMHSDGYITDIIEDLIEVGVNALNSQLFCMNIEELGERFKGRITFWGEIDRQEILPSEDPEVGREAVRKVKRHLCNPSGGVIAQFEIGPGANPETAVAVLEEWAIETN